MSVNPKIKKMAVGSRTLREVTIYPFSLADQLKMSDIIAKLAQDFISKRTELSQIAGNDQIKSQDMDFITRCVDLIKENISSILSLVCEEGDAPTFDELTNDQLIELSELIFSMNYEDAAKNVKSLLQRMKKAFAWKQSVPSSSDGIQPTVSTI